MMSDPGPIDSQMQSVYEDLRQVASRHLLSERANHTLQPTAVVHEVYLRMSAQSGASLSRAEFMAVAATMMRRVLVDHARRYQTMRRGQGAVRVPFGDEHGASEQSLNFLDLHEALEELARRDPTKAQVVELHFFSGLSFEELATHLEITKVKAVRDWIFAKAWLAKALSRGRPSDER